MATLTSIRILLAIAVHNNLGIVHADIPRAFLKARLDTNIWLQLPPGSAFKDKDGRTRKHAKLICSLLGWRIEMTPIFGFLNLCLFGPFRQKRRVFGRAATRTPV